MTKFGVSQSVKRKEDVRFLVGKGQYIDDVMPQDALCAQFLLSPVAHAKIISIDVDAARDSSGVHAVYTAEDLIEAGLKNRMKTELLVLNGDARVPDPARTVLAEGKVRFVGDPVVIVIADTINQARDAIELIEFEFEELPAHMELNPGGTELHSEAPRNVAFDWQVGKSENVDKAFSEAKHVISLNIDDNRVIASSMETRGCFADWKYGRLHVVLNGQGVWSMKEELSLTLGLDPDAIRVTTPDVGGGFGMKAFMYPEYFAVAQAAKMLGRSIRWMGTRSEAMLNDNDGRDLTTLAELAFNENYRITALRVSSDCNMGAYNSMFAQHIQTELCQKVITGVYDIPNVFFKVQGIFTNTSPIDAYRGAGRPEGIYIIERTMDHASRKLGVDQLELRRKNFINPEQFPYFNFARETVDVGEFAKVLDRAEIEADLAGFSVRRDKSVNRGKLRGLGICYYIETILGNPDETTKIEFCNDGMVNVYVGTQSNGQGHETAYAQILNERSGIPFENIRCIQGDSDLIEKGGGTGGSRSVTTQGTSINGTADKVIEKFIPFAADLLDAEPSDMKFDEGTFRVSNTNRFIDIIDVGLHAIARSRDDLITTQVTTEIDDKSFPNGAHICEVEVDPETGSVKVKKYTVVDDLGFLINPLLAAGQVQGGVVQGIGQAVLEHVVFDEYGQLLSGTFMDYALPRADSTPFIEFYSEPTPSKNNPIGMKGCGEAGTIGALAAVANAVQDAVWEKGIENVQIPLTPNRVWNMLNNTV